MYMQNSPYVGTVKGGYSVGIRTISTDIKKTTGVPVGSSLDSERALKVSPNVTKELEKTKHTPLKKGHSASTSNSYKDVAKIVYKKFTTIDAIKESFSKLKANKSPGLDDLVKAN